MAHLTENFTFEGQLSPRVRQAISAAFEQGWADPKKLSQSSHRALDLRTSAIEEFAALLNLSPAAIEIVGEPNLLHHLAIGGFLHPETHLRISAVDVGKIRAVARSHSGTRSIMTVSSGGDIDIPEELDGGDLLSLQAENGETGKQQDLEKWRNLKSRIALDATRTTPRSGLVEGFAIASFDALSWSGPSGLGFLAINDVDGYRYPFAHIAPIRTPGSYSLPLLIGAVVALNEYREIEETIFRLRNELLGHLREIDGVRTIGSTDEKTRYLSFLVDRYSGEEVLRALLKSGINIDAGSACSAEDLAPSHVIAAMGLPTTGHLRATIHAETNTADIENLATQLKSALQNLRS